MKKLKKAPAAKVTLVIAGHSITLTPGRNYLAARPMAERGRRVYPVRITARDAGSRQHVLTVPGLTYTQANDFLADFNNGVISLSGRDW